jgi:hypothetical protein
MKKGPLSNKEKKTIEKKYQKESVANIATSLDRSTHMIEKHIMKLGFNTSKEDVVETPSQDETGGGAAKREITHLLAKNEDRGVVIMTKEASMASDDNKKKRKPAQPPARTSRFIHRIKE